MGIWDRLFGGIDAIASRQVRPAAASELQCIEDPALSAFLSGKETASGRRVGERNAMRNATFNRAVRLVAGTIGMLPLNLIEKLPDGRKKSAEGHPVHSLLRKRTNAWQQPGQFKSYMQGRALLTGDAYAFKVPGVRGVQALVPMDPSRVKVELSDAFDLTYVWQRNDGGKKIFRRDEVLHLRAPWSSNGINGDGLLSMAAEALGLAEAADMAAARLMRNGSYVGGALTHPKNLSKEASGRLREQFEERYSGPENAGRWMVLEEDMKAQPFGMTGRDAEGLAQRKHQAEEISRFTDVPRPLLMFDETSWGTGIEQLGLFFVTYCLLPWFVQWEEAVAAALLTDGERDRYIVKFNEAALLRGSLKDQAEFLSKAIGGPGQGGWMVPDEARDKFDMNPLDDERGSKPAWGQPETTADA